MKTPILLLLAACAALLGFAACSDSPPTNVRSADITWRGNTGSEIVTVGLWIGHNGGYAQAPDRVVGGAKQRSADLLKVGYAGKTVGYFGEWSASGFTSSLTGLPPSGVFAVNIVSDLANPDATTAILTAAICGHPVELVRQN